MQTTPLLVVVQRSHQLGYDLLSIGSGDFDEDEVDKIVWRIQIQAKALKHFAKVLRNEVSDCSARIRNMPEFVYEKSAAHREKQQALQELHHNQFLFYCLSYKVEETKAMTLEALRVVLECLRTYVDCHKITPDLYRHTLDSKLVDMELDAEDDEKFDSFLACPFTHSTCFGES